MTGDGAFQGPSDLHTHSRASDGTQTPHDLVLAAAAAGLGTIALTDHDSTAGWDEAARAAIRAGITLIPGLELSTRIAHASVHLLGYLPNPANAELMAEIQRIRSARLSRAAWIVEQISADYDLTWDDVLAQTAEGAAIGRPHIADALVARGVVTDRSAAFAGILHWNGGYYRPLYAPDPEVGVRLVRDAGGVPVLAHPAAGGRGRIMAREKLARLVDAGLFGLEIEHRENTPDGKVWLYALAAEFGLAVTGSSDYHGAGKPNQLGENTTDATVVAAIIAEGTGSSPVYPARVVE
ncbi:MAG: PHP domain-containing protein [Microbacteriaceae bacterium]